MTWERFSWCAWAHSAVQLCLGLTQSNWIWTSDLPGKKERRGKCRQKRKEWVLRKVWGGCRSLCSNWLPPLSGVYLLASLPSAPSFCSPTLKRQKATTFNKNAPFLQKMWRLTFFLLNGGSFQTCSRAPRPCWAQVSTLSLLTWWKHHKDLRNSEIKRCWKPEN